ncbi:MAG: glucose-6-phosphate isomerase [Nitrospirae bacterium]|nr:glucose-6-phosphate isomerase [Nitrospirota bacterium]
MLELKFGNMMEEVIGEKGLSVRQIENVREKAFEAHKQIQERRWKELAFLDLVNQDTSEIKAIAKSVRENSDYFLLLGIGGSAMGPKTILEALKPYYNFVTNPKIFIYDNIDPRTLYAILSIIDPARTTVNVVTKSGNTAETIASFMVLWKHIEKKLGSETLKHFIITTNPDDGIIRAVIEKYNIRSLSIASDIVGRYSVLSPAGLLMAEVAGIDSNELLRGASDIAEKCKNPELWENPVYLFSIALYLMSSEEGRNINVMMPYADGLRHLSEWFCQLWAESLGKLGFGITPYPSVGTTDQHSQLQLWMEGPEDKVIIFINIDDYGKDIIVPEVFSEFEGMKNLSGHTMNDLIKGAAETTKLVLSCYAKPNMTLGIPTLDAYHIGQLFLFLELSTACLGFLFGVNPFNQPWVETGKKNIYGMLGRTGFQKEMQEIESIKHIIQDSVCWRL